MKKVSLIMFIVFAALCSTAFAEIPSDPAAVAVFMQDLQTCNQVRSAMIDSGLASDYGFSVRVGCVQPYLPENEKAEWAFEIQPGVLTDSKNIDFETCRSAADAITGANFDSGPVIEGHAALGWENFSYKKYNTSLTVNCESSPDQRSQSRIVITLSRTRNHS